MSGPRVWVDENDLRLVMGMVDRLCDEFGTDQEAAAMERLFGHLDPPPPPPLRPYRACMQGHGA